MSVTMSDIAARTGTSIAAVSVALNGAKSKTLRISEETRGRILKAAEELGYRRNPFAGALATGRTMVLGFLMPPASFYAEHDPFFSTLTNGITGGASKHGYNVMFLSTFDRSHGDAVLKLIDRRIDGLITAGSDGLDAIAKVCKHQGIALVSIMDQCGTTHWNVDCDDAGGAQLATKHLIDLGHERIAHLAGKPNIATSAPRLNAYKETLREADLPVDDDLIALGEFTRAAGYKATTRLMELPERKRPTAIFAANDLSAHGAIEALHDLGLDVPGDVAVVGFDDTWYSTITRPALTTVNSNVVGIGEAAVDLLVNMMSGERAESGNLVMPVSLIIRESCGFKRMIAGCEGQERL